MNKNFLNELLGMKTMCKSEKTVLFTSIFVLKCFCIFSFKSAVILLFSFMLYNTYNSYFPNENDFKKQFSKELLVGYESDLKVETFRSSGAGGQSVNTTDSAVRVTHVPTGLTVSMQDERSQHRNRAKALSVLLSRLYDHERSIINAERDNKRNQAVTSADRSQRIRTYNFPQSRITDHRISLTLTGSIESFMNGDVDVMDQMLNALIQQEKADALSTLMSEIE